MTILSIPAMVVGLRGGMCVQICDCNMHCIHVAPASIYVCI